MRTSFFCLKLVLPLFAFQFSGCENSSPARKPQLESGETKQEAKTDVAPTLRPAVSNYNWSTIKTGSALRLKAMMGWYLTQTDNMHQMDFIEGQAPADAPEDGPAPLPQGPYSVTVEVVDAYVGILKKSGYFSDIYLHSLITKAHAKQKELEHAQPPKNTVPSIEGLPLFPRNYDDMMSRKESLLFSVDKSGNVVTLNDGFTLRRFTFDAKGRIDSVNFTSVN